MFAVFSLIKQTPVIHHVSDILPHDTLTQLIEKYIIDNVGKNNYVNTLQNNNATFDFFPNYKVVKKDVDTYDLYKVTKKIVPSGWFSSNKDEIDEEYIGYYKVLSVEDYSFSSSSSSSSSSDVSEESSIISPYVHTLDSNVSSNYQLVLDELTQKLMTRHFYE